MGGVGHVAEDDGPLFLSHGDVLGVVVPVIAKDVELSLEFVGDGEDEGVVMSPIRPSIKASL